MGKELEQMLKRKEEILAGDAARVKAQHDAGKLTARERIDKLLGAEFTELDQLTAGGESGVVTGYGVLAKRPCTYGRRITPLRAAQSARPALRRY